MTTRLVLVGMGVDAPVYEGELAAIAGAAGGIHAHFQIGAPTLLAQLDRLCAGGYASLAVVGVARGRGTVPGVSWLRRVVAHWWRELEITVRPVVVVAQRVHRFDAGDDPDEQVRVLRVLVDDARPITGNEPGLTSSAWEEVPGHRYQVLVCRGPRCSTRRSDLTSTALAAEIERHGLGDDDILITQTGCQFPCNHAPVIVVQPDDVWYGDVTVESAAMIVREHLIGGSPVAGQRLARRVGRLPGEASQSV